MNLLITGGAGYLGTELTHSLSQINNVSKIIVYDNLSRNNYNLFINRELSTDKVKFIYGDLLDSRKLKQILKNIDVVFHLAAKVTTPFANEDSHFFEQVNHWGTAELIYAIEASDVSKLIYTSSTSIYGSSNKMANEKTIPNPNTYYGTSKYRGEQHVERISNKINACTIRCGNVYGYSPSMRFDAVINRFMFEANFNNRISIHGNGKQSRAYIHIDKVTAALVKMLEVDIPSGTYNLVEKNLSILELSNMIKDIYPDVELLFINQHLSLRELKVSPDSKLYNYFTLPEKELKEELLSFKEKFSFSSALKTIEI